MKDLLITLQGTAHCSLPRLVEVSELMYLIVLWRDPGDVSSLELDLVHYEPWTTRVRERIVKVRVNGAVENLPSKTSKYMNNVMMEKQETRGDACCLR